MRINITNSDGDLVSIPYDEGLPVKILGILGRPGVPRETKIEMIYELVVADNFTVKRSRRRKIKETADPGDLGPLFEGLS